MPRANINLSLKTREIRVQIYTYALVGTHIIIACVGWTSHLYITQSEMLLLGSRKRQKIRFKEIIV